ncbi:hypothetical protein GCM10010423_65650 [Streptomyces levis]|uniref:Uncharacterized protein n=1 Tax=Streptomyces levis TaxID=285566 RepID=A0ABN3P1G3_9ACTN
MPVIRRKKTAQVTTGAKGRAVAKKGTTTAPKKAARGSAKVTTVAKPTSSSAKKTRERQVDPVTGFGIGTDADVMIKEAMKGGNTRPEIIARIKGKLPKTTSNGTEKPVANVFASVLKKKTDEGWIVESSWVLRPPTSQSKAKSTKSSDNVTPISKNTARKRVTPRKKAS